MFSKMSVNFPSIPAKFRTLSTEILSMLVFYIIFNNIFPENPEKPPMFCEMLGNFADVEFGVVHKRFNLLDLEKCCRVIFLVPKVGFNTAENGPSKVVSNQPRNTPGSNEHL